MGDVSNIGELAKPVAVLIEKISNAIGVVYEPTRIRRQAQAEADAEKIRALMKIELAGLEERALERLVHQEARRQQNIENITVQAARELGDDAQPEQLSEDWIANFFKQCDTVSDEQMQSLWAKLLAGEAHRPGTYSRRTVNLVASLDKSDAALFTALGQFVWQSGLFSPLVFDLDGDEARSAGLNFQSFNHLATLGLATVDATAGYRATALGQHIVTSYFGSRVTLTFASESGNELSLGKVLLTDAGQQLFPLCGASRNERYFQSTLQRWRSEGKVVQVAEPAAS